MKNFILLAGATGDLSGRIIKSLISKSASVHALVRSGSDKAKLAEIEAIGATVVEADLSDSAQVTAACKGASCIVSALAGLRDVIIDTQLLLLHAADILSYNTPFYNLKEHTVAYWGDDANWQVDFTTKDNAAEFTAAAALDADTPTILRVASFKVSAVELVALAKELNKGDFQLKSMGSLADFSAYNKRERAANPEGENQLYAKWQQSQYMHSMFSVQNEPLDNDRYPGIVWTGAAEVIAEI